MAIRKTNNNAATTLDGAIDSSVTSVTVIDSSVFPTIVAGEEYHVTLVEGGTVEIIKVTAVAGNILTVTRAAEGGVSSAFSDAIAVEMRPTADSTNRKLDKDSSEDLDMNDHFIRFDEISLPTTPVANSGLIYVRDDGGVETPYFLDSAGTETSLLGGGGGAGDMVLADVQSVTGAKTFDSGKMLLAGATSGTSILNASAVAGATTFTLPTATDTLVGQASTDTLTNKTIDSDGTGNVITNIGSSEVKSELISGQGSVTAATGDELLIIDADDSSNLKRVTAQTIADLGSGTTDHGALTGLTDDDHSQYSLISSQSGVPGTTPGRVGEVNIDTTADTVYISTDVVSSSDWSLMPAEAPGGGIKSVQTFTASGTWTKPAGIGSVRVYVQAAGGGGGGAGSTSASQCAGGAGGGGGSLAICYLTTLSSTETITIGASGAGGVGNAAGSAGGESSFGILCVAGGGNGGGGGAAGTTDIPTSIGGIGGTASTSDVNSGGGGGGQGNRYPTNNRGNGGTGGDSHYGGGGQASITSTQNAGKLAKGYGGGGGGAANGQSQANATGADGTPGIVYVVEFAEDGAASGFTQSSTNTLTNKTIDADGTGNVITNVGSSEIKSEIISGQTSVTAATGDELLIIDASDSSNTKRVTAQSIADLGGGGGGGGGWTWVESKTASASNELEFKDLTAGTYKLEIEFLIGTSDTTHFYMQVSNDNGSSYATVDYQYAASAAAVTSAAHMQFTQTVVGNQAGEYGISGRINIIGVADAARPVFLTGELTQQNGAGDLVQCNFSGMSADDANGGATLDVDAVKIFPNLTTIASGTVHLYKLVTS